MKRRAFLLVGLLAAVLGLTTLVDTAFSDGVCACCIIVDDCEKEAASNSIKACATGSDAVLCGGSKKEATCVDETERKFEVNEFPKKCRTTESKTMCDEPSKDCKRGTACQWNKKVSPPECQTKQGDESYWIPQNKPTTAPCP